MCNIVYRIAICDDEEDFICLLGEQVSGVLNEKGVDFEITAFSSGEALFEIYQRKIRRLRPVLVGHLHERNKRHRYCKKPYGLPTTPPPSSSQPPPSSIYFQDMRFRRCNIFWNPSTGRLCRLHWQWTWKGGMKTGILSSGREGWHRRYPMKISNTWKARWRPSSWCPDKGHLSYTTRYPILKGSCPNCAFVAATGASLSIFVKCQSWMSSPSSLSAERLFPLEKPMPLQQTAPF